MNAFALLGLGLLCFFLGILGGQFAHLLHKKNKSVDLERTITISVDATKAEAKIAALTESIRKLNWQIDSVKRKKEEQE